MTKIDEALKLCGQDQKAQPLFYDLFLNSMFFIPTLEDKQADADEGVMPLLLEADDKVFLMIFDTIKRLTEWADEKVKYVALPGHMVTEMSTPNLHWAMNYGTKQQKIFDPEEINWLKDIIRQTKQDQPAAESPSKA